MSWDQTYDYGSSQQQGFYGGYDGAGGNYGAYQSQGYADGGNNASSYPSYMTPDFSNAASAPASATGGGASDEFGNEPPLLEELGIQPDHIIQKTLSVLNPMRTTRPDVAGDADLAGPLAFCLAFGAMLMLTGKIHFNYIYGIGCLGSLAVYGLLTLMNARDEVALTVVVSVLGYCILPIVALSGVGVVMSLQGVFGTVAAVAAVLWCALSASKLFVAAFDMEHQQLLVAYPCCMLYALFALITVF